MPMEKQAGVQRCGTRESSRDNFHLISHHQKLLHKIIVNYGGLLCIWFPTAATTAVTFLKIKCMFHLLTGREEGEKGKERKNYDGIPTESSCAIPWSHSLFHDCTLGQVTGTRGAVALGKMGRVNQKWSQSRPTRAVSSSCNMFIQFIFPATHFCLLSPARDTTQSRLFQFLSSKAGCSTKSPCNCQELCNSIIRASKPVGNEGPWGSKGRVFPTFLHVKPQHKAPS